MNSSPTDIKHFSTGEQAAYVALFRLRAALGCSDTVVYQIEERTLSESDAVGFVLSQAIPAALSGVSEGPILKLQIRAATENDVQREWAVFERFRSQGTSSPVALEAKGKVLVAHAAGVERSLQDYPLSGGYSMGVSFNDSDGPLADRARELGVFACFTLGPAARVISAWITKD